MHNEETGNNGSKSLSATVQEAKTEKGNRAEGPRKQSLLLPRRPLERGYVREWDD